MKILENYFFNIILLITVAITGYGLTVFFDQGSMAPRPIKSMSEKNAFAPGQKLPGFRFTTIKGKTYNIQDFSGKIILVNFWATWCAPCIVEFPSLLKIAADNKDKIVLIALSSDMSEKAIHDFLEKLENENHQPGSNVLIALDNEDIARKLFGTTQLPETYIAGPDNILRNKLIGADWAQENLQKIIDSL